MNKYRFNEKDHVHLLANKPLMGTSSITGVISMGSALNWWASGKALELLGWTPSKTKKTERETKARQVWDIISSYKVLEWLELLDKCYKNWKTSLDDSAEKGTDLHYWLEQFVKREMNLDNDFEKASEEILKRIEPFIKWSEVNVKQFILSEAYCYSEELWTGGICDCAAELNNGNIVIIDFKSSKEAYLKHFIQCAGYAIAIEENGLFDKDGNEIKVTFEGEYANASERVKGFSIDEFIVFPFGAKELKPWYNTLTVKELKEGFISATKLYSLVQKDKKED